MRPRAVAVAMAFVPLLAACSVLPETGGKGSAVPEQRTVGQVLAGDAERAARTLLDAWRDNDRDAADRIATDEAVNALFAAPYPDAPPRFVSCGPDDRVPDADSCFFQLESGGIILQVLSHPNREGWEVRSLTFLDR